MLVQDSEIVRQGQGKNIIPSPEKPSWIRGFLEKFKDPLIIILLVVFFFSIGVSFYEYHQGASWNIFLEPAGVLIALLLATGVGFVFEVKAEQEFEVLNLVKDDELVKVVRKNPNLNPNANFETIVLNIPKKDVCVGDLVRLEAGDEVPADGHILKSNKLLVDESAFTGEPFAEKNVNLNPNLNPNVNLNPNEGTYPADFLLRGSIVMEGSADYEVSAVGMETEEGKGAARVQEGTEVKTPLNRQLDVLGKWISTASFVIGVLIVIGRMIFFFCNVENPSQLELIHFILGSIMIAVTLIVVAVPEGLPMSITVSLAMSMRKMLKENNLVRKLHACETMGAATIICTDKTGTLTQNRMTVVESLTDKPLTQDSLLALGIAVNSTAELNGDQVIGNPTEGALLLWLRSQGIDYKVLRASVSIVEQQPFSSQTKFMQTTVRLSDGRTLTFLKGAPEIIAQKCLMPAEFSSKLEEYQSKAYRTLAFCYADNCLQSTDQCQFEGGALVGIADPIREDVPAAIDTCQNGAHVKVMIVTGDTTGTANEIGRQIGLLAEGEEDKTITGADFASLEDEKARQMLRDGKIKIIARARPDDKARLVVLLQRNGEVVAVTGDGTNDAPALSKAQVGLSMGDGTARAKEASDITIIDNSFASINKAILWGRSLYQNIRRFIIFQLTVNVCACFIVLLGAFTGLDSPLSVTQMLWVNLIMDTFAAMALSSLPADPKVMTDYPRSPKAHILDRSMLERIVGWGMFFFAMLAIYWLALEHGESDHHLERYDLSKFFTFFVFLQFWNLFNTRYFKTDRCLYFDIRDAIKGIRPLSATFSKSFVLIAAVILVGQVLIVECAGDMFDVETISLSDWLQLFFGTSLVMIVHDVWHGGKVKMKKEK